MVDESQNGVMMAWETSIMRASVDELVPESKSKSESAPDADADAQAPLDRVTLSRRRDEE